MTYREYMEAHKGKNLNWCRPYLSLANGSCMVVKEGREVNIWASPEIVVYGANYEDIRKFAKYVNADYNLYSGWSNLHIALDAMCEVGCSDCPFNRECEAMDEDIDETDYR